MIKKITDNNLLILLLSASIFALVLAYIAQFIFNYQPCVLCLYQRKPFFAIIALASLALVFFKNAKGKKIAVFFCAIFLLINGAIAAYQVGVEKKIFHGPATCSSQNLDQITNLKDLEIALKKTKSIRCDEPSIVILGLSMAAWNLIYCIFLVSLLFLIKNSSAKKTSA